MITSALKTMYVEMTTAVISWVMRNLLLIAVSQVIKIHEKQGETGSFNFKLCEGVSVIPGNTFHLREANFMKKMMGFLQYKCAYVVIFATIIVFVNLFTKFPL